MVDPNQYVPLETIATHFAVSPSTVRNWIRRGVLQPDDYMRLGAVFRFKIAQVEAALRRNSSHTTTPEEVPAAPESGPVQLELDFDNPDQDL
jgi:uncharacterized protein YjcR